MVNKKFKGGETQAIVLLGKNMKKAQWVASFQKPKTIPTSLEPDTTGLSAYLKFGCISSRTFFWDVQNVYTAARGHHSRPPESLHGQLFFREWFYLCAYKTPHFDKMILNPICKQIEWGTDKERLEAWSNGMTGFPAIDATMR